MDIERYLIDGLPRHDMDLLSSEFLRKNCRYAAELQRETPCGMVVRDEIFLEYVLPHAFHHVRVAVPTTYGASRFVGVSGSGGPITHLVTLGSCNSTVCEPTESDLTP